MKQCPKCNTEHEKAGLYCSRSCGNSRVWSKEINESRSAKLAGRTAVRSNPEQWKKNMKQAWLEKYNSTPFDKLGSENRKRRVLEDQEHKCNHCGISEWNGNPIVLELEHKDGNNTNNTRENLECICPNCHSQTTTWRGRNNKGRIVPDEILLEAVKNHSTISDALRSVGLPSKGNSHKRAKRLLGINK
jgi:5-methylcytosine-specific restriction endonuclease McrA